MRMPRSLRLWRRVCGIRRGAMHAYCRSGLRHNNIYGAQDRWLKNQFKDASIALGKALNDQRHRDQRPTELIDEEDEEVDHSADDVKRIKNKAKGLEKLTKKVLTNPNDNDTYTEWISKAQEIVDMHGQFLIALSLQWTCNLFRYALARDVEEVQPGNMPRPKSCVAVATDPTALK